MCTSDIYNKAQIIWVVLILCVFDMHAQNLVPNPGFEDTIKCPSGQSEIWLTKSWYGLELNGNGQTTPDFFHSCCQKPIIPARFTPAVPANSWGYQLPATGQAYAGAVIQAVGTAGGPNSREYLGIKLSKPLITDKYYRVQFKANLANSYNYNTSFASNNVGALFMFNKILNDIPNKAHVNYTEIIKDTFNWTLISGYFKADTAYTHLALGNFFKDALSKRELIYRYKEPYISYYYFDDVSVYEFPKINIRDTTICIGDSIFLNATYSKAYAWQYRQNDSIMTVQVPAFWAKPTRNTTYVAIGSDNVRDSVRINVYPPPQVNLGHDITLCPDEQLTLNAYNDGAKYTWSTGEFSSAIIIGSSGEYWVRAEVGTCFDTDTIKVNYKPEDECIDFLEVFPNPFIKAVHIAGNFRSPTKVSAHLFDMLGRDLGYVLNTNVQNKFDSELDLLWIKPAMYLMLVKWDNNEKLFKIVKLSD